MWHPDMPESYKNAIVTGDARELARAIPDGSIDLIFTDPVYSERWMYDWLAEAAQRVLKPHGAVLVWSNGKWHRKNTNWLENAGLNYRYDFAMTWAAGAYPMNGKIVSGANRLIWCDVAGESRMLSYLKDGYVDNGTIRTMPSIDFRWFKSYHFSIQALRAFTTEGDVVYDPFCGGASIPAVCKTFQREWLASEIDPDTARLARERVAMTQPPLFIPEPEQAALEFAS